MDTRVKRIFLYVDATIGNDFIYSQEVGDTLLKLKNKHFREVIVVKNTQASHMARVMTDLFVIKEYPRRSIKKALTHSSVLIHVTDGQQRLRKHRVKQKIDNQVDKFKIIIRL